MASQVVLGLQTVVSRQTDITRAPAVVTVATIHGGVRSNIIPDSVVLVGTVRTFDEAVQDDVHARIRRTAEQIAAASGAQAVVRINKGNPVTFNDPDLTRWGIPTLQRAAGAAAVYEGPPITGAEDFSLYQKEIPGVFFFLGITPEGSQPIPNHSPLFIADERALPVGVRTLAGLAADYLLEHARGVSQDR